MASLADDIANISKKPRDYRLRADTVLGELEPVDRDDLRNALDDPAIRPAAICRAMASRGISLSEGAIVQWRRSNGTTL